MTILEAMRQAQEVQAKHPDRLLCGSLALILYGAIDERSVGDLDFVTTKVPTEESANPGCESEGIKEGEGYQHFHSDEPFQHCVFVLPEVEEGIEEFGLRLQSLREMVKWKKKFGRPKDRTDLKIITM